MARTSWVKDIRELHDFTFAFVREGMVRIFPRILC